LIKHGDGLHRKTAVDEQLCGFLKTTFFFIKMINTDLDQQIWILTMYDSFWHQEKVSN
jgi:hypothetical protein